MPTNPLPPPPKVQVQIGTPTTERSAVQIGGLPSGLDQALWPATPGGESLTFLGQFPLESISSRFKVAYVFMAQTYCPETSECINETFDPTLGLTRVVLGDGQGTERAEGPSIGEPKWFTLRDSWLYGFDTTDDSPDEWTTLLDDEETYSVRIGGPLRWWQGGSDHPLDIFEQPMKLAVEFLADTHPGLDLFIGDGVCHVLWSDETGETGLVWEIT